MQDLVEPINNGSCKYNPEMLYSDPEHGYKVNGYSAASVLDPDSTGSAEPDWESGFGSRLRNYM